MKQTGKLQHENNPDQWRFRDVDAGRDGGGAPSGQALLPARPGARLGELTLYNACQTYGF